MSWFGDVLVYSMAMEKVPIPRRSKILSLWDDFNSGVQSKETPKGVLLLQQPSSFLSRLKLIKPRERLKDRTTEKGKFHAQYFG